MPPVLKNFCGSVSLRTSTIVVGGLSLIGTLFGLIDFLVKISSLYALEKRLRISLQKLQKQEEELQELEEETNSVADNPPPSPPPDYAAIYTSFLDLLTGLTFLVYSIMILFHCLLIYGAYKGKKMLLLPWLACQFVGLIFNFILMIISFWFFSHFEYDDSEISKDLKLIPLLLFISAIAFWVVYSHFVELMEQDQYTPPDYATTVVYDQRAGYMTPDMNFQENKVIVSNGSPAVFRNHLTYYVKSFDVLISNNEYSMIILFTIKCFKNRLLFPMDLCLAYGTTMVLLKTCCCGFLSLQFGTIAIGFITLILGLFSLIGSAIVDISKYSNYYSRLEDLKKQYQKEMGKNISDHVDVIVSSAMYLFTGLVVFVHLIYLANSCLLIYGAWKGKKMFLLPWMGWHYTSIIIQTIVLIVFFWFFSLFGFNGIILAYVLVYLFVHVLFIFLFLVVYSHFQELSEKEASKPPNYSIY